MLTPEDIQTLRSALRHQHTVSDAFQKHLADGKHIRLVVYTKKCERHRARFSLGLRLRITATLRKGEKFRSN
jgi:hypothetical protein